MNACIKRIVKPLFFLLVAAFFSCLVINPAKTQAADAIGGSSIETAVQITPGQYNGPSLEYGQAAYYKITINAGQELKVVGNFTPMTTSYGGTSNSIRFYDENRVQLVDQYGNSGVVVNVVTAVTLASSVKASQTYYIEITDDSWGTASSTLDVSLTDRFDANSTTDAGQTIETAMSIEQGEYSGYLSQVDSDDYYSVPASAGQFTVSITPYINMSPTIEIYDQNRTLLATQWAQNAGEIFQITADVQQAGNVYVHINCNVNYGCVDEAYEYTFTAYGGNNEDLVTTAETTTTGTTAQQETTSKTTNYLWWIVAAVAGVIVMIIIIVLVARRKKPQSTTVASGAEQPQAQTPPPVTPTPPTSPAPSEPEAKQPGDDQAQNKL